MPDNYKQLLLPPASHMWEFAVLFYVSVNLKSQNKQFEDLILASGIAVFWHSQSKC